jgi:allophanate hydrolase subunit 1
MKNMNSSGGYDLVGATSVKVVDPQLPPPPTDPCPTNPCMPQN